MDRIERIKLIKEIQDKLQSKLIIYILGDRQGLETRIAPDSLQMINKHLIKLGEQERITLFLYSAGGLTITGYALVNLIREFCKEFNVVIPFKALSCATLIALGANKIIMTRMGQLSPVDPSINHPLGPVVQIPGQPSSKIAPINVEDVNSFIKLAKDEIGIKSEESLSKILEVLSEKINPIVLGAIYRSREQIAFLGTTLMGLHTNDEAKIKETVNILIRQRFSHDYIISRREAKNILNLNIEEPDKILESSILKLFNSYNDIILTEKPYNPELELGDKDQVISVFNRGVIESEITSHFFRTEKEIRRLQFSQPNMPPQSISQEKLLSEGWVEDKKI